MTSEPAAAATNPSSRKEKAHAKKQAGFTTRVLHLRVKDKHGAFLLNQAREVNFVWNFCQDHALQVLRREHVFCSAYDLHPYIKGAGAGEEGLSLHSQTLQAVTEEYVTRRKQFKKAKLNWRVSNPKSPKYSLGWIPFKASAISRNKSNGGQVRYCGKDISLWDSYGLSRYELGSGNFSQDSRGRWYLNVTVTTMEWPKSLDPEKVSAEAIGIDLGLKDLLCTSEGIKVEAQQFYRDMEPKLAVAQRAKNKQRVKSIHAKIANRRKDALHKLSTALVSKHQAIFVGDVNASSLAKTNMAKSVLDAGWSTFRTMLQYKCDSAGVWFREVNESFTTQDCSCCGARCGPKGQAELNVRHWTCKVCGTRHHRDTNAATNIKVRGQAWLEAEFEKGFSTAAEVNPVETAVNKDSQHKISKKSVAAGVGHGPLDVGIPLLTAQAAAVG